MPNPVELLRPSVVRFYRANGNVVGAGFLVAAGYVLTCAHVVAETLGVSGTIENAPKQSVQLDFPLLAPGQTIAASVVFWKPVSQTTSVEDLAILKLLATAPVGANYVTLNAAQSSWKHSLAIFGFPQGYDQGVWATGVFRGPNDKGWIQFDSLENEDRSVEKGFSGAPIWDETLEAVVGMAVAAEKRRASVTSAYMIPRELLRAPLNYLRQQILLDILQAHESAILGCIQRAYRLCRSQNAITPVQQGVKAIIDELAYATAGAQQTEDKLIQFAAALCLELEAQQMAEPRESLQQWGDRFAEDFEAAKSVMQDLKVKRQQQRIEPHNPMLLVNIQEDASSESLSVEAWIILDPEKYNSKTLQGSRRLLFASDDDSHLSEQNVSYDDLPILLDSYLMQLCCDGSEYECDPRELTLYFILPPSLLNKPLERLIPGDEEDPIGIGLDDSLQVILALHNRSGLGGFRADSRWKKAWTLKAAQADRLAHEIFADMDGLKESGIIGLKQLTSLNPVKDPRVLAKQGMPLALWVRDNQVETMDWAQVLLDEVLSYPVKDVPERVLEIRRNTSLLDSETEYAQSTELGHHLAILWDDPKRVPPTTSAPLSSNKL